MSLLGKVFVFPFMVLPESFYRFIALVLPSVQIMEVIKPAVLPQWNRGEFQAFRAITQEEEHRKIAEIYRGYKEFAKVHGEKHLIDTISLLRESDEWDESRLMLRSAIRTPEENRVSDEWVKFVEAALIMELSRDLDERDIELDSDLSKVHELESQFRLTLGLDEGVDDDLDESVKVVAEHLPRRSYFGYMVTKRITSWLRLYGRAFRDRTVDAPLLLCITREVVDELVDPLRTRIERGGQEWQETGLFEIAVPNIFEKMTVEEFEKFASDLLRYDRKPFWDAMARVFYDPQSEEAISELRTRATELSEAILKIASSGFSGQIFEFGAFCYPQVRFQSIYESFLGPDDKISFEHDRPLMVLFLNEKIVEERKIQ